MTEYTSKIPLDLKPYYDFLHNEVVDLHLKWDDFSKLFIHSQDRIDLLNKTAGSFFRNLQSVFPDDFVATVSRLTDPLRTSGKENLTFPRLFEGLDSSTHSGLHNNLKTLYAHIQLKVTPFRELRNRKISHSDLLTALRFHPDPLPGISKESFVEILDLFANYLNTFSRHFDNTTVLYNEISRLGHAEALVRHLENALKWREEYFKKKLSPGT